MTLDIHDAMQCIFGIYHCSCPSFHLTCESDIARISASNAYRTHEPTHCGRVYVRDHLTCAEAGGHVNRGFLDARAIRSLENGAGAVR